MPHLTQSRFAFIAVLLLTPLVGCGHGGRMAVEGTVSLDGKPLEKGAIQFCPQPGTSGPTAGADIVAGRFSILPASGPFAGRFSVQITSAGPTGRKILDPRSNTMVDEYGQIIPARYSNPSELRADITSTGSNRFEFSLKSK